MTLIKVGFSGTRHSMTRFQVRAVYVHMCYLGVIYDNDDTITGIEAHHGDCLGADFQFHTLATALGWRTVAHPPVNPRYRAWCQADEIREPLGYLVRDRNIANETGELMAAPEDYAPRDGSGTWYTAGYGVRLGRRVQVYLPDGTGRPGKTFYGALLPGRPS